MKWIVYYFPLSRLPEFIIGVNLGCFFVYRKNGLILKNRTIEIIGAIILCAISQVLFILMYPKTSEAVLQSIDRWWTLTVVFTISSAILIIVFAVDSEYLSKKVCTEFIRKFAKASGCFFLIHFVVLRYMTVIIWRWRFYGSEWDLKYGIWIKLILGFVISYLLSDRWMKFEEILAHKRKNVI